jgi:uncharacterized protein (TIGR00725 family)
MDRVIAVSGSGHCSRREYDLACEVGRLLAGRGFAVVTGGLLGVMEAACMGAKEAGGRTIGVLPGYSRLDANRYVDVAIPTGLRHARNVVVATIGEALIAVGGGLGTLSEIAVALRRGVPVVGLGTWRLDPDRLFERRVPAARTPEEAVEMAVRFADETERTRDFSPPWDEEDEREAAPAEPEASPE